MQTVVPQTNEKLILFVSIDICKFPKLQRLVSVHNFEKVFWKVSIVLRKLGGLTQKQEFSWDKTYTK